MSFTLTGDFAIAPRVLAQDVGGELVLLDADSGVFFSLNPTGARFWTLVSEGLPVESVRNQMLAEFDVTPEVLERDLLDLVEELLARELLIST